MTPSSPNCARHERVVRTTAMTKRKKGETPVGLLTTTRFIEADGALASSEIFEKLLRALAREFVAAEVVYALDGIPWVRCRLSRNRLAPLEVHGPVRIRTHGNKAEVIYEARLRLDRRQRWPAMLGVLLWPLWPVTLRLCGRPHARSFDTLERAMDGLYLDYRAVS